MAPERSPKRQKTDETVTGSYSTPVSKNTSAFPQTSDTTKVQEPTSRSDVSGSPVNSNANSYSSWYASLRRKAPPVTEVARESIRSFSNIATNAITKEPSSPKPKSVRSHSLAMTLGKSSLDKPTPVDATITMIHATPVGQNKSAERSVNTEADVKNNDKHHSVVSDKQNAEGVSSVNNEDRVGDPGSVKKTAEDAPPSVGKEGNPQAQRSSWLGWLGRGEENPIAMKDSEVIATEPPPETARPIDTSEPAAQIKSQTVDASKTAATSTAKADKTTARRSWLYWNAVADDVTKSNLEEASSAVDKTDQTLEKGVRPVIQKEQAASVRSSEVITSAPPNLPHDEVKPAGWAFWSRERKVTDSNASIDVPHEGEIAISNTPSQTKPRAASISLSTKAAKQVEPNVRSATPQADAKIQSTDSKAQKLHTKKDSTASKTDAASASATAVDVPMANKTASVKSSRTNHNLLMPALPETLKLPESPSIVQQLARVLRLTQEPDLKHLSLIKDPPRIRNALAIGVHGYFPAPLIRTVLGQPTGTSIKFAEMAAKSIRRWTTAHNMECEVKTVALEGEGKIADRVDLLWKLLLNWIEEIRKSDFVLVACHSQGVPVAVMLVAKLIQFGCISGARIGICAMAGVNMGPFVEYKSRWISGSAGELFEFSDPQSKVSSDYLAALNVVLKFGARLTYIGSIDDQLVSLESSIFASVSHPHIYRAVSIDARVHAPSFLSHLVGFALKLRNLGVQDHGLIRELSPPLAGSLYTGEGHSRIYDDDAVYDLAISFALETNTMDGIAVTQRLPGANAGNPYILPFAMRGILEEDFVKNQLQDETSLLLKQFDEWKPTTKVLKDVKFRLEGIRSKI